MPSTFRIVCQVALSKARFRHRAMMGRISMRAFTSVRVELRECIWEWEEGSWTWLTSSIVGNWETYFLVAEENHCMSRGFNARRC